MGNGMKKYSLLVLILLMLTACGGGDVTPQASAVTIPVKTTEDLLATPLQVSINGLNFILSAYLWRDFMPGNTDSRLIASITISEINALEIPAGIDAVYLWVVNGSEVWETPFSDEPAPPTQPYQMQRIARYGPEWEIGASVDVIVFLVDAMGGEYFLRIPNQLIHKTV